MALAQSGDSQASVVFNEAIAAACAIQDNQERSSTLGDIAVGFAQVKNNQADVVFNEAIAARLVIQDDQERAKAMYHLTAALAQVGRYDQSKEIALAIKNDYWPVEALRSLAAYLAHVSRYDDAKAIAYAIRKWVSPWALRDVAIALIHAEQYDEAEKVIHTIEDEDVKVYTKCDLAVALAWLEKSRAEAIFEEAKKKAYHLSGHVLHQLATSLAQIGHYDESKEVADLIKENNYRAEALCVLVKVLAQTGHIDKAGQIIRSFRDEKSRVYWLCWLADHLTKCKDSRANAVLCEAMKVVSATSSGLKQDSILRRLAASLTLAGRFKDAFATLGSHDFDLDSFLQTLAEWAPSFEQVEPGLSVAVLYEGTGVAGWVRPDWRKIHELVWLK